MEKYILYRLGKLNEDNEVDPSDSEELVAVEYGNTLDDVLEDILRGIRDDLEGLGEYAKCSFDAYGPTDQNYTHPPFSFMGVVVPPAANANILYDYTVEVEES